MSTGFYLYDNPNRNAPIRDNGIRFHGYPQRRERIRVIVIHTAENTPQLIVKDGGAEAVASFQSRVERPSSYHEIWDSNSFVPMLPDNAVAFGAIGANAHGWHGSFATRAHLWPFKPQWWIDQALAIAAARCRRMALSHKIPVRFISRTQWKSGEKGFISHARVDPARRTDPGGAFPWGVFLNLVKHTEDEMKIERLIHVGARGGSAYVPGILIGMPGKMVHVRSRAEAEAVTGDPKWHENTIVMPQSHFSRYEEVT